MPRASLCLAAARRRPKVSKATDFTRIFRAFRTILGVAPVVPGRRKKTASCTICATVSVKKSGSRL